MTASLRGSKSTGGHVPETTSDPRGQRTASPGPPRPHCAALPPPPGQLPLVPRTSRNVAHEDLHAAPPLCEARRGPPFRRKQFHSLIRVAPAPLLNC